MASIASDRPVATALRLLKRKLGDDVSVQNIYGLKRLDHGHTKSCFLLRSDLGYFTLKIYPPESSDKVDQLVKFEAALHEAGVSVPEVIGSESREDGSLIILRRFVDAKEVTSLTEEQARKLGKCLATADRIMLEISARESAPSHAFPRIATGAERSVIGRIKSAARSTHIILSRGNLETAVEKWQYRNNAKHKSGLRDSLVHSDLWLGNILFSNADEPLLIDWDKVMQGRMIENMADTVIRCFFKPALEQGTPVSSHLINVFLKSYHENLPLNASEIAALPAFIRKFSLDAGGKHKLARGVMADHYLRENNLTELLKPAENFGTRLTGPLIAQTDQHAR